MYVDNNLLVAGSISGNTVTPQALFASGANVNSANVVDLLQNRDLGDGKDIYLRVQVGAAFTGGTSVEFQAIIHDDTAQSVNVQVVGTTGAIPVASLTAGKRFVAELNPQIAALGRRYISMRAVNVGANAAGTAMADFGIEVQDGQKFYPSGFAIL